MSTPEGNETKSRIDPRLVLWSVLVLPFLFYLIFNVSCRANKDKRSQDKNASFPEMVFVQGGSFMMGTDRGDSDETPIHKVKLNSFYIAKYEVTFAQYNTYCDSTKRPRCRYNVYGGNNCPVTNVSWMDAVAYCSWLSQQTGDKYRLPTEAEWEYAARGGNKSEGYIYSGSDNIDDVSWFANNSYGTTHPVGSKGANEIGLYDMTGNVWEWCFDIYGQYSSTPQDNPVGVSSGKYRVCRGGNLTQKAYDCRTVARDACIDTGSNTTIGFRVVRVL